MSTSSCSARSRRETAAALTNWGRLPMTVATRTWSGELRGDALLQRGADLSRDRPGRRQLQFVDGVHGQRLLERRGQERLLDLRQLVLGERVLFDCRDLEHAAAGDRVEDVLAERRREQTPRAHVEQRRG